MKKTITMIGLIVTCISGFAFADSYSCQLTQTLADAAGVLQGKTVIAEYKVPASGSITILEKQVANLPLKFSSYRDVYQNVFYTRISKQDNSAEAQSRSYIRKGESAETTLFSRIPTFDPNTFIVAVSALCKLN